MLKAETPNRTAHSFERAELRGRVLDGRYRIGEVLGIGGTAVDSRRCVRRWQNLVVKVLPQPSSTIRISWVVSR